MSATHEPRKFLATIVPEHHLDDLARNGFVRGEALPSGNVSYKLRYRLGEHQKVIRLGVSRDRADAVKDAVEWLQRRARNADEMAGLCARLRLSLRETRRLSRLPEPENKCSPEMDFDFSTP